MHFEILKYELKCRKHPSLTVGGEGGKIRKKSCQKFLTHQFQVFLLANSTFSDVPIYAAQKVEP